MEASSSCLMKNYKRLPIAFVRGEGVRLWDEQGKSYLDTVAGIAVCNLGHAHPKVSEAVAAQAAALVHTSNLFRIPLQETLAQRLCALTGLDQAFFCNSGAEANEAAIKLARLFGHQMRDLAEGKIVVFDGAFHGRTMAALAATGNYAAQKGFSPMLGGFLRASYGDLTSVETLFAANPDIVAVLVEPVQGESGVRVPPADFLPGLRALCDQYEAMLVLDEVQTGMGRTGQMFAYQEYPGLLPDVMLLAKGLGNGFPIGAVLAKEKYAELFAPGRHGSTFGGGPLACAAAQAVLDVMTAPEFMAQVHETGKLFKESLIERLADHPLVREIRGKGLMLGMELVRPVPELATLALEHGLVLNVTAGNVLRFVPPLVLSADEVKQIIDIIDKLMERV